MLFDQHFARLYKQHEAALLKTIRASGGTEVVDAAATNGGTSTGDEMASAVVQSYKELIRRQDEQLAELQARLAHTQSQPGESTQNEVKL